MSSFEEEDAGFFFGRNRFLYGDSESSSIGAIAAVERQPLVTLLGSSGSGKSSAIFAGLIPTLRKEQTWLIQDFRPKDQPINRLAAAFVRILAPEFDKVRQVNRAAELSERMNLSNSAILQTISNILEIYPEQKILIIIDQFEEIYTLCSQDLQSRFIELLLATINVSGFHLLLSLRSDFYGYIIDNPSFRDIVEKFPPQLISSMKPDELRECIERPANKLGVSLEADLTQRILDDVGQEPGNLPLLEFTLFELWRRQEDRKLTHRAYDEIGGVRRAIANHAEKVYEQLAEDQKAKIQYIFTQLVYPGQVTEDTRRLATQSEIGEENWNLVNSLTNYTGDSRNFQTRLLVTGWDETKNENTVEIVHEALIRQWHRLQEWIATDREFRTWQESLRLLIQNWRNPRYKQSALLRGELLREAENWLKQRFDDLSPLERKFIYRSRVRERAIRWGLIVIGATLAGLSFISLQVPEARIQQQLAIALSEGSADPKTIQTILPRALRIANLHQENGEIDKALNYYRDILRICHDFLSTNVSSQDVHGYENQMKDILEEAESSLVQIVVDFRLSPLEQELKDGRIGHIINGAQLRDYEERYTDGALKETYKVIMMDYGVNADVDGDGQLSSFEEAQLLPCDILRKVEELWRENTKDNSCGWYGSRFYRLEPDCNELVGQTLVYQLFDPEFAAIERIDACNIVTEPVIQK